MQALNLLQQHSLPLPHKLGPEIGSGSNGQVFELATNPQLLIKLSVIFDLFKQPPKEVYYGEIQPVLDYVMNQSPSIYVRIQEHGYLGDFQRKMDYWKDGTQAYVLHYYVMEKLLPLSEDETKLFHSIISHEDRNLKKDISPEILTEALYGLSFGLDFDRNTVMSFCQAVKQSPLQHLDLAPRNIMKDVAGNYKCVDLDNCFLNPNPNPN